MQNGHDAKVHSLNPTDNGIRQAKLTEMISNSFPILFPFHMSYLWNHPTTATKTYLPVCNHANVVNSHPIFAPHMEQTTNRFLANQIAIRLAK